MTTFLDTNVLLYAVSVDSDDRQKKQMARRLVRRRDIVFSIQVVNEFICQATRPAGQLQMAIETAMGIIDSFRRFPVIALDFDLVTLAADVARRTQYSWWDALIVAAAIQSGCDRLFTEDLQHGRVIDGVRIENPFRDLA